MITVAAYTLGFSLAGIIGLFSFKIWEMRKGVVYAAFIRVPVDRLAVRIKRKLSLVVEGIEDLPHFLFLVLRWSIHTISVAVARAARMAERRAYSIADRVSYKRHVEKVRNTVRSADVAENATGRRKRVSRKGSEQGIGNGKKRSEFLTHIGTRVGKMSK